MKREKSCGALVYRVENDELMLLLLRHRKDMLRAMKLRCRLR